MEMNEMVLLPLLSGTSDYLRNHSNSAAWRYGSDDRWLINDLSPEKCKCSINYPPESVIIYKIIALKM